MKVGSLQVRMLVRGSRSLKDKRQVVRSMMDRLRQQFNISIAEVDARDHVQMIVLGIATVGEEAQEVRRCLDAVTQALRVHPVAEFLDHELEA